MIKRPWGSVKVLVLQFMFNKTNSTRSWKSQIGQFCTCIFLFRNHCSNFLFIAKQKKVFKKISCITPETIFKANSLESFNVNRHSDPNVPSDKRMGHQGLLCYTEAITIDAEAFVAISDNDTPVAHQPIQGDALKFSTQISSFQFFSIEWMGKLMVWVYLTCVGCSQ